MGSWRVTGAIILSLLRILTALLIAGSAIPAAAQSREQSQQSGSERVEALRVFLDCDDCDFDYMRIETPWVAYVRDRTVADVHVLITEIGTGGGGSQYTLNFEGRGRFQGRADTLQYNVEPGQSDDVIRRGLTRVMQLGLIRYATATPFANRLQVTMLRNDSDDSDRARTMSRDPWNAWVFELGLNGSTEREEQQADLEVEANLSGQRITNAWKIGFLSYGEFNQDRFELDDRTVKRAREHYLAQAIVVKSIGNHWGLGTQASLSSSTFENAKLVIRAAPAIEYSLWSYDEATRRQLTLQYSIGISSFKYREETIFGRLSETRPTQTFVVGYDVRQPWGSADATLVTSGYVDEPSQYRVVFDGEVELRLFQGFALEFGGSAALLRDQIALVKRDATPEEVLLELRALRTNYRYDVRVGFSYTFGSIFNSVVNPRFGGGVGQILR